VTDLLHADARPDAAASRPRDRRRVLRTADRPARRSAARTADPRADRCQAHRRGRRHRTLPARPMTVSTPSTVGVDLPAHFPILGREINGGRLVYLDSSSTSQKPASVLAALDDYYRNHNANIHRGVYVLAQEADALFEGARARIAAFLRWPAAHTIFTRNVTEAINLVAYSWARTNLRPGDAVLISEMEHHSNIVPWQLAAQATGAELRYLEVGDDGTLSLEELERELDR